MDRQNGHKQESLGENQLECLSRSPDAVIYEIVLQVLFYDEIEQEKEVFEQLEMTGEQIALMLHQFKAGGFLPSDCRILWNTKLTKQYLKGIDS